MNVSIVNLDTGSRMMEPFNDKLEGHELYIEWTEWKEGFQLWAASMKLTAQEEKCNWLLTTGGRFIRRMHANVLKADGEVDEIPATDTTAAIPAPVYDNALKRLDKYFNSKSNKFLQKDLFRAMRQTPDEDFTSFLIRLREQVKRLGFDETTAGEELIYQMSIGAKSSKVRTEARREKNVEALHRFAIDREAEEVRMKKSPAFPEPEINAMHAGQPFRGFQHQYAKSTSSSSKCYRCHAYGHSGSSKDCPAWGKKCAKCGKSNHMALACRSKRKHESSGSSHWRDAKKPRLNHVAQHDDSPDEVDYH